MKGIRCMLENTEIWSILVDPVPEREMSQHNYHSNLDGGFKFKTL